MLELKSRGFTRLSTSDEQGQRLRLHDRKLNASRRQQDRFELLHFGESELKRRSFLKHSFLWLFTWRNFLAATVGGFIESSPYGPGHAAIRGISSGLNLYHLKQQLKRACQEHYQGWHSNNRDKMLQVEQKMIYRPDWAGDYQAGILGDFMRKQRLNPQISLPDIYLSDQTTYDHSIDTPKEELWSAENIRINTIYQPPKQSNATVVIFLAGQGSSLKHSLQFINNSGILNTNMGYLLFEYPGFGQSTGYASENALYGSLEAVSCFLVKQGIPYKQQFLVGPSLGGAVATELATKHEYAGLVLISTFKSAPDIFQDFRHRAGIKNNWYPSYENILQRYNTYDKIKNINCGVIIGHGEDDDFIDQYHGRDLIREAQKHGKLKGDKMIPGVGHDITGLLGISQSMFKMAKEKFNLTG